MSIVDLRTWDSGLRTTYSVGAAREPGQLVLQRLADVGAHVGLGAEEGLHHLEVHHDRADDVLALDPQEPVDLARERRRRGAAERGPVAEVVARDLPLA